MRFFCYSNLFSPIAFQPYLYMDMMIDERMNISFRMAPMDPAYMPYAKYEGEMQMRL